MFIALHSLVRFIILLVAVVGVLKLFVGLMQKRAPDKSDQALASAFVGLYDLQVLLGLLIIFLGVPDFSVLHPIVMFVGVVAAHGLQAMTKRADGLKAATYRLTLYIVPLAIILVGLATINHLPI